MEQLEIISPNDTIAAISTPSGTGGIAVVRVSGPDAMKIVDAAWKGKPISLAESHTIHLGKYMALSGEQLDEAVAAVFMAPNSFTGEDVVELSIHGSRWIQREILSDLIKRGARIADPGEFSRRAFINGKMDLAQAEGVADLIASSSRAAHALALSQTKGAFSREFDLLRNQLVEFASLLELELDFSEEDVEFADRSRLLKLAQEILGKIQRLADSYSSGAVIKDGVPTVIAGIPNAGKSSLLNLLLGDDKAIVSDIPGTTRDIIEDTIEINGILYRFIDTAGLRDTNDTVEGLGIERAKAKMNVARIVIWLIDPTAPSAPQIDQLRNFLRSDSPAKTIVLKSKADIVTPELPTVSSNTPPGNPNASPERHVVSAGSHGASPERHSISAGSHGTSPERHGASEINSLLADILENSEVINFSAKTKEGLQPLLEALSRYATDGHNPDSDIIITNARHFEALSRGAESLRRAILGIESGISADFIAQDIRETTHHLATITGSITTDTLLHSIFSRFCIGK